MICIPCISVFLYMSCGFKMFSGFKISYSSGRGVFPAKFLEEVEIEDPLFYIQYMTCHSYIHTLIPWNHSFMPVVVFYQLANKQGDITCQPENQFGKHYHICHTVLHYFYSMYYFIKMKMNTWKWQHHQRKGVVVTTSIHSKWSGWYLMWQI